MNTSTTTSLGTSTSGHELTLQFMDSKPAMSDLSKLPDWTKPTYHFMELEAIKNVAPRVFATGPTNPHLSKHYTFASTETVINDMARLGWKVTDASQPHPRRNSNGISSFHYISFMNERMFSTVSVDGAIIEQRYPKIILTNSHDGFNCFTFRVGLERQTYRNGMLDRTSSLVLATDDFTNLHIRHIGYTFDDLRELVNKIVELVPDQIKVINTMSEKVLSDDDQRKLALAAIRSRQNNPDLVVSNVILDDIIMPEQYTNTSDTLWEVFNTIQHKMLEGEFQIMGKKGLRKARRIKSIMKTITLNQALFKTAVEFTK